MSISNDKLRSCNSVFIVQSSTMLSKDDGSCAIIWSNWGVPLTWWGVNWWLVIPVLLKSILTTYPAPGHWSLGWAPLPVDHKDNGRVLWIWPQHRKLNYQQIVFSEREFEKARFRMQKTHNNLQILMLESWQNIANRVYFLKLFIPTSSKRVRLAGTIH